jgi:translocation and assembly module TamB
MRFEADVQVREKGGGWTTDRLALALLRASKWGPGIGPEEAIRWEGRGQYDPAADRLTVDSIPHPPAPRAESVTWIGGKQSVRIDGIQSPATARAELTAGGDVGTVVSWLSTEPAGLIGKYEAVVQARHDRDHWNIGSRLVLRDLARAGANNRPQELGGDVTAELSAVYAPDSDQVTLSELTLKLPNAVLAGSGTVRGLSGRPVVDLKGSLDLDWAALSAVFAEKVEPRARITGSPRAWKLAGTIDGIPDFDQMGSLKGDIGVQIDSVDVFGMRLGQTSLVVRSADGRLTIDPIDAKLNDGDVHLEPELVRAEDRSIWLHMGPESRLDGAVVNDEVSHRVLSYAAPVLDGATRVDGRVSLTLASAYVPISAGTGAQTDIRGDVLFDNMRFMPGPLAEQLLAVFNRDQKPLAVLREPVKVRVLGRKVYQQGLVIPVVNVASIGIDGSVDFDQNLDLVARFALVPPRGNIPVITPIMTNAHFDLPIRGTLKKPKIDGDALKERWKAVGTGLLSNSMEAGVDGLQRLLQGLPIPGLRGLAPRPRRATPPPPAPDAGQEPAPPGGGDIDNENNDARTQRETFKPAFRQNDRSLLPSKEERLKRKEARKQERLQKKADRQADRARDPQ